MDARRENQAYLPGCKEWIPGEKIKHICQDAKKLMEKENCKISPTGKLNDAKQVIPPAPFFYKNLQYCLNRALERGTDNSVQASLAHSAKEELKWWQEHLTKWNGRCLIAKSPDMVIETDASTTGRGACCQGVQTGGPWSQTERDKHINWLELPAANLAVKSFVKGKKNILIHLRMDNTTALTYINKCGETVSQEPKTCGCDAYKEGSAFRQHTWQECRTSQQTRNHG